MNKIQYRPILRIPKTKFEIISDIIGCGVYILALVFLGITWSNLPDKIPGHFNALGEVDRWGSKYEMIILPFIGLSIFVIMSLLEKAPHIHNYPKRLNESNVEQFYLQSRKFLNVTKNICLVLFATLIVQIVRVALDDIQSLGIWYLPIFLIVIFGAMLIGIYKSSKIR